MAADIYKTVKVPLGDIVQDREHVQIMFSTAQRVHSIVEHGFEFMQIVLLVMMSRDYGRCPPITDKFAIECLNTVCLPNVRPQQAILRNLLELNTGPDAHGTRQLRSELAEIYYEFYAPKRLELNRVRVNAILGYAATEITTAYKTNIHVHIHKHVALYVDTHYAHEFIGIAEDVNRTGAQKKTAKNALKRDLARVTTDILQGNGHNIPRISHARFHVFIQEQALLVMPSTPLQNESIKYHAKADSASFIKGMVHMSNYVYARGGKTMIVFPRRHDSIPSYYTLCSQGLNTLLPSGVFHTGQNERRWDEVFNRDHKHFKNPKGYVFKNIQTDGIGANLKFVRNDCAGESRIARRNLKRAEDLARPVEEHYISDIV